MPIRFSHLSFFSFLLIAPATILTNAAQPIVGSWPLGDGSSEGSGFIVFYPNGYYVHVEDVESSDGNPDGMEKGTYVWNEQTGVLGAVPIIDTNDQAGLSHPGEDENLRLFVSGDTLTISTNEGNSQISRIPEVENSILGTWIGGDVSGKEHIAVNFFDTGYFAIGEEIDPGNVSPEEQATTGIERGTYTWDSQTGSFTGNVILDTNGEFGISSLDGLAATFTVLGDTLTVSVDGEEDGTELYRLSTVEEVEVNRSLTGAWNVGSVALLSFADDGTYYQSANLGSENPLSGMERGNFSHEADTFNFSSTAIVDTNDTAGASGYNNEARLAVHNDLLYRWLPNGSVGAFTRVKGKANTIQGAWQFGDRNAEGSGVIVFLGNELLENKTLSGLYILSEDVEDGDGNSSDGTENGVYRYDSITNRLTFVNTFTDTNGDAGLSNFDPASNLRIWALGESMVIAERDIDTNEYEISTFVRVSEPLDPSPGILLDKLAANQWVILRNGLLQSSDDLDTWIDIASQPGNPWFPFSEELDTFYRTRSLTASP